MAENWNSPVLEDQRPYAIADITQPLAEEYGLLLPKKIASICKDDIHSSDAYVDALGELSSEAVTRSLHGIATSVDRDISVTGVLELGRDVTNEVLSVETERRLDAYHNLLALNGMGLPWRGLTVYTEKAKREGERLVAEHFLKVPSVNRFSAIHPENLANAADETALLFGAAQLLFEQKRLERIITARRTKIFRPIIHQSLGSGY